MKFTRILSLLILGALLFTVPAKAQTATPPSEVQSILNSMSPEERVGQLFLVTFNGTDTSDASQIYSLITNYHVGGVVLLTTNDNFVGAPDTIQQTSALIQGLQSINWDSSTNPATGQANDSTYIPLFVGLAQEG